MSGSVNDREGNQRLHFPHVKSQVDLEKNIVAPLKGLYRYRKPEQAITAGNLRSVTHQLRCTVEPPVTFFNAANNFCDVVVRKDIHYINALDVILELKNTDACDDSFDSLPHNLFTHYEVRKASEVIQTVTDLEQTMHTVIYRDPWEHERHQLSTWYDASAHGVDSTTVLPAGQKVRVRVRIYCNLTACGIPVAVCKDQLSIRFYSQVASNVLATGDIELTNFQVLAHEIRGDLATLRSVCSPNVDWRFLDHKHQEKDIALTSGQTAEFQLTNFSEADLCSHMWLFVRNQSLAGANRDDILDNVVDSVWLEDESGHNMTNGIQFLGEDLLNIYYPDKFNNRASETHGLYLIFCPSLDPMGDYKRGLMTGAQPLLRNMVLKVKSAVTGTRKLTVVALCHKHLRIQNGELIIT